MTTYRKKLSNSDVVPVATTGKTFLGYVNLGLPSNLNLDDDGMNWAESSSATQSVDQEYTAYGFGAPTKLDVDILKFWEVSKLLLTTRILLNILPDAPR
jgi:hypothetical protein